MTNKIQADLKAAMLAKDEMKKSVLRMLLARLQTKQKETGTDVLSEEVVLSCIEKEIKDLNDQIEMFTGHNEDRKAMCETQRAILQEYMPKQLEESKVIELIEAAYNKLSGETNLGKLKGMIIKEVMPQIAGKFDKSKLVGLVGPVIGGGLC